MPFGIQCAKELLNPARPVEQAMICAAESLNQCYMALSGGSIFASDVLKHHSTLFALQCVALESHVGDESKEWKVKPKLHLFLELCSEGSKPALFWGKCGCTVYWRRVGVLSVPALSKNLLTRFQIHQPTIRMR